MTAEKPPTAPVGLGTAGKALWRKVCTERVFSAAEGALLETMCAAFDRHQEATVVVSRDGLVVDGRFGVRQHPAAAIARDSAQLMRALAKQLDVALDDDEPKLGRPGPKPTSRIKGQKAAIAARKAQSWGSAG